MTVTVHTESSVLYLSITVRLHSTYHKILSYSATNNVVSQRAYILHVLQDVHLT